MTDESRERRRAGEDGGRASRSIRDVGERSRVRARRRASWRTRRRVRARGRGEGAARRTRAKRRTGFRQLSRLLPTRIGIRERANGRFRVRDEASTTGFAGNSPRAIGFSPSVPTRRAPDSAILPKASEAAHASPDLRGAGGQTRGRGRARWHSRGSSPLGRARDVVRGVLRGDECEGGAPRGRGARRARRAPRRSSPRHVVVERSVARRRGTRRAPRRRPASRARRGARPRRRPRLAPRVAARRRARGDDRGVGRRAQGAIDDASSEGRRR